LFFGRAFLPGLAASVAFSQSVLQPRELVIASDSGRASCLDAARIAEQLLGEVDSLRLDPRAVEQHALAIELHEGSALLARRELAGSSGDCGALTGTAVLMPRTLLEMHPRKREAEAPLPALAPNPPFSKEPALRSLLFSIVRRVVANCRRGLRSRGQRDAKLSAEHREPTHDPGETLQLRDDRAVLDAAPASLDSEKREVFVLFQLEGLDMPEVCSLVGCATKTGYLRLYAARDAVRKHVLRTLASGRAP